MGFRGYYSMVDGKAVNALCENKCTQRCPYCNLLPREYMAAPDTPELTALGKLAVEDVAIGLLHFGLRIGDHLLKIGYHQDFKKYFGHSSLFLSALKLNLDKTACLYFLPSLRIFFSLFLGIWLAFSEP